MLTDKTLMILGASILQLPAIEKALEMGLKVVALDMNPDAVGFNVPGVIREIISTIDIPAAIKAARVNASTLLIHFMSLFPLCFM